MLGSSKLPAVSKGSPRKKRRRSPSSDTQKDAAAVSSQAALRFPPPDDISMIDWSQAFPPQHIKKIMEDDEYQGEDSNNVGVLLQPATQLITACSALWVRNLVRSSSSPSQGVNLSQLRKAIQKEGAFLEGVLDEMEEAEEDDEASGVGRTGLLTMSEGWGRKKRKAPAAQKKKKRKDATTTTSTHDSDKKPKADASGKRKPGQPSNLGSVKEALRVAGDPKALMGVYKAKNNSARQEEVILDEEDYD